MRGKTDFSSLRTLVTVLWIFSVAWALMVVAGCADQIAPQESGQTEFSDGQYIVVLKKSEVVQAHLSANIHADVLSQSDIESVHSESLINSMVSDLADRHGLERGGRVFTRAVQGGVFQLSAEQAHAIQLDDQVAYLEKDQRVHVNFTQSSPTWGLDRLDQNSLPLNQSYRVPDGGVQVNAYVIDTGILASHQDFQGRAFSGIDLVDRDSDSTDCNGHGTHVAGTIGSSTYGVAKNVRLFGVRVLDCSGSGQFSDVVAGIEWVTRNHLKPAVANMSLGGGISQAVDDAVNASISSGVTYVVAAGNEGTNACNGSPARVAAAITVGATTSADARASYSNYGSCVDIFAPGSDIKSLWFNSSAAVNTISGTSMATPHVVGAAALYLASRPGALPLEVRNALVAGSVSGKISSVGSGSPNLLLNIQFLESGVQPSPSPTPIPSPQPTPSPNPGSAPCIGCDLYQGNLNAKGAVNFHPSSVGFTAKAGVQQYWLQGPPAQGIDFDLVLYKKSGSTWVQVAQSTGSSSQEKISYSGAAGTYRVKVLSYSGVGAYQLYRKLP